MEMNGQKPIGEPIWYLTLKKLLMPQGPATKPSSLRLYPGQRFTLDGDEPIDVEALLRTRAVKIYEESDAAWAQTKLTEIPKPKRRNRG